jgi:hypothetical protein
VIGAENALILPNSTAIQNSKAILVKWLQRLRKMDSAVFSFLRGLVLPVLVVLVLAYLVLGAVFA